MPCDHIGLLLDEIEVRMNHDPGRKVIALLRAYEAYWKELMSEASQRQLSELPQHGEHVMSGYLDELAEKIDAARSAILKAMDTPDDA